jgi:hypothetical protein
VAEIQDRIIPVGMMPLVCTKRPAPCYKAL